MKIKRNIGGVDFIFRLGLSLVMLYFGLFDNWLFKDQLASITLTIIGALSLLVALLRHCPFYALLGINTCSDATTL